MNHEAEKYLKSFSEKLRGISGEERDSIVLEIKNHIYESINQQKSADSVLNKLGNPEKLAKAYTVEYQLTNKTIKFSAIFDSLLFGLTGITGIILIPTLLIISLEFTLLGLGITGIAITNAMGLTSIPLMVINSNYQLTGFAQLISSFFVTILLICLSAGFFKLIQKYCKYISGRYHKIRLNK